MLGCRPSLPDPAAVSGSGDAGALLTRSPGATHRRLLAYSLAFGGAPATRKLAVEAGAEDLEAGQGWKGLKAGGVRIAERVGGDEDGGPATAEHAPLDPLAPIARLDQLQGVLKAPTGQRPNRRRVEVHGIPSLDEGRRCPKPPDHAREQLPRILARARDRSVARVSAQ